MKQSIVLVTLLVILFVGYQTGKYFGWLFPAQTVLPEQVLPSPSPASIALGEPAPGTTWSLEEVVNGLQVPWSIAFTSPARMLVTERAGRVRVVSDGLLQEAPLHTFKEIQSRSEEGLMGMTLDPEYERNHMIYFCYAVPVGKEFQDQVVRMLDAGDHLENETVLLTGIPAATNHAGCRIKFGPDQKLYVTTGEATDKKIAQDLSSLGGKILRMNADGTIPEDNPIPKSYIYSYGHRNPQGIDWHPITGALIETEHGPSVFDGPAGGDEVNFIQAGGNYGWPVVSHDRHQDGMRDPILVFTPAVAPASGMFYSGKTFPEWSNHFFFGLLRGEGIMHVIFDASGTKPIHFEKMVGIDVGRVREIVTGPDGDIYFSTSNQDGRGTIRAGDDRIYRITSSRSAQ